MTLQWNEAKWVSNVGRRGVYIVERLNIEADFEAVIIPLAGVGRVSLGTYRGWEKARAACDADDAGQANTPALADIQQALNSLEYAGKVHGAGSARGFGTPSFAACLLCDGIDAAQENAAHFFPAERLGHAPLCTLTLAVEALARLRDD